MHGKNNYHHFFEPDTRAREGASHVIKTFRPLAHTRRRKLMGANLALRNCFVNTRHSKLHGIHPLALISSPRHYEGQAHRAKLNYTIILTPSAQPELPRGYHSL